MVDTVCKSHRNGSCEEGKEVPYFYHNTICLDATVGTPNVVKPSLKVESPPFLSLTKTLRKDGELCFPFKAGKKTKTYNSTDRH